MYRMLGAVLIGLCAVYMGGSMSARLKKRLAAVTALRDSFLKMQQKISYYRLPVPVMLREVSVEQADMLSAFYAKAADQLERNHRKTAEKVLSDCLREEKELELPAEARQCCMRLFSSFGRVDAAHQEELLRRSIEELDGLERRLREDVRRQSRCYCALGVCGGLAVTILLV